VAGLDPALQPAAGKFRQQLGQAGIESFAGMVRRDREETKFGHGRERE
jgi:hypothetical protein